MATLYKRASPPQAMMLRIIEGAALLFAAIIAALAIAITGLSDLHDKLDDFIASFDEDPSPFTAGERRLMEMIEALSTLQDKIMSEIEDLNAAIDQMGTAVNEAAAKLLEEAAAIQALSQKPDAAAMESAAQRLAALATTLTNAVTPPATDTAPPPANPPGLSSDTTQPAGAVVDAPAGQTSAGDSGETVAAPAQPST